LLLVSAAAAAAAAACLPGAVIAARLRGELLAQLAFTASAGIGPNKLLAKIGSARNKPNQQTLLLPRAVQELMQVRGGGTGCWAQVGTSNDSSLLRSTCSA
jgi:nucleotidyltransferase/DNA polymerase involved in DNA repair